MALSPTPSAPLRNEPRVLGTSAVGGAAPSTPPTTLTPTTARTAPRLKIDKLVLAPPAQTVTTPGVSVPFTVDDFWQEYSELVFGVGPVEVRSEEQIATMLDGMDFDTVFLCAAGLAGGLDFIDDIGATPDGLRILVKSHTYRASKGIIRHLVLPTYDCSVAPLDEWYGVGKELGLTSLHMHNYARYVGTLDINLEQTSEEIVAGFGVYSDFVREDSLKAALDKRFVGAKTARVLWEAFGTADNRALPRPTPETTTCRSVRGALDLNIRRVPAGGERFPDRAAVSDQLMRVNMFF